MSILPCMKCKHSLGSSAPNLFCDKFHVVVDHRGGCGVGEPIVMTNADRIRSMTDEELAEFLRKFALDGGVDTGGRIMSYIEWLKEEARDGSSQI